MRCDNCGTENNFEWATFCRSCQRPLSGQNQSFPTGNPHSTDQAETKPVSQMNPENEKIEIGVADPMDYIMGNPKGNEFMGAVEAPEEIRPESAGSEMTLYRDQDVKLSISEAASGAEVTVESLKNDVKIKTTSHLNSLDGDNAANLQLSDSIIPSISDFGDEEQQAVQTPVETKSYNDHFKTEELSQKDTPNPSELMATQKIPVGDSENKDKQARPKFLQPEKPHHESTQEQEPQPDQGQNHEFRRESVLSEVKLSKGVLYVSGKNLILPSNARVTSGDVVTINEKPFEIKVKPGKGWLFYAGIGVAAAVVFFTTLMLLNSSGKELGQLAGTVSNINGIPLSGQRVNISELGKTVTTNQAGMFVFDQIPAGIYTISYQSPSGMVSDRTTVLKEQTSMVALKESQPRSETSNDINQIESKPASVAAASNDSQTGNGKGTLKLSLTPGNASVYVNDKPIGVGSNSYKLAEGNYTVTVKKAGFADKSQNVKIESDKTVSLKIALDVSGQAGSSMKSDAELAAENEASGNYAEAERSYSRILERNPRDLTALLGKARCAKAEGLQENAISYFMQAAKLAADKGDANSQIAALTGILAIKPNTLTAYTARGEIYYSQGQYSKAIEDYSKIVEMDTRNLGAYYKLGESFYKTQEYSDALKTFLAAKELNFADPKAEAYLAKTYLAMGDKKNCKKSYERFKDLASYASRLEFKKDAEWQKVLTALGEKE
jgi:tetratricopeptide (TPR) repeat protein